MADNRISPDEQRPDDPTTCKDGGDDCTLFKDFVDEIIDQELAEANAMASGNVVGYTGPLGMDTEPGHKLLWSDPEDGKGNKLKEGNVLDKQGHHHVGSASRKEPYGDTYVDKDDSGKQADIIKKVNKNMEKKPYGLHDPPSMGLSITRPSLKDRK